MVGYRSLGYKSFSPFSAFGRPWSLCPAVQKSEAILTPWLLYFSKVDYFPLYLLIFTSLWEDLITSSFLFPMRSINKSCVVMWYCQTCKIVLWFFCCCCYNMSDERIRLKKKVSWFFVLRWLTGNRGATSWVWYRKKKEEITLHSFRNGNFKIFWRFLW